MSASGISTAAATNGANHRSCLAVNWNTIPICFSRWPNETFSWGFAMSQSLVVAAGPVDPRPGARAAEYLTSPYAPGRPG
ncbi:hypothetical protein Misp05_36400 [Micromonospora sp. NBRC 107095]|nr:hypothetical protein Misp05_36400 [Micromonospora sp. NBRC 107095]